MSVAEREAEDRRQSRRPWLEFAARGQLEDRLRCPV